MKYHIEADIVLNNTFVSSNYREAYFERALKTIFDEAHITHLSTTYQEYPGNRSYRTNSTLRKNHNDTTGTEYIKYNKNKINTVEKKSDIPVENPEYIKYNKDKGSYNQLGDSKIKNTTDDNTEIPTKSIARTTNAVYEKLIETDEFAAIIKSVIKECLKNY